VPPCRKRRRAHLQLARAARRCAPLQLALVLGVGCGGSAGGDAGADVWPVDANEATPGDVAGDVTGDVAGEVGDGPISWRPNDA